MVIVASSPSASSSPTAFAEECRAAALEVLDARAWTKAELVAWLVGSYRPLTLSVRDDDAEAPSSGRASGIAAQNVEELVARARDEVTEAIARQRLAGDWTFAERALCAGHVAKSRSAANGRLFVPVDAPRRRLADRVLSLLAVDYLVRPDDYYEVLRVCTTCRRVSFAAAQRCDHADSFVRVRATGAAAPDESPSRPRLELVASDD